LRGVWAEVASRYKQGDPRSRMEFVENARNYIILYKFILPQIPLILHLIIFLLMAQKKRI
jgi:hypothetical protein